MLPDDDIELSANTADASDIAQAPAATAAKMLLIKFQSFHLPSAISASDASSSF